MFEVGFTEIILILGIALLVLGPEKLPKVAREAGRWMGRARAMARQLKSQLDDEVLKHERDWDKTAGQKYSPPRTGNPPPRTPPPAAEPAPPPPAADTPPADDTAGPPAEPASGEPGKPPP